jgi:hypothetical protein
MDSVNIHETMVWVVQCITRSALNVPFVLEPKPDEMSNFVITDKQW